MKFVSKVFYLCECFIIAYINKNTKSRKQIIKDDDETASSVGSKDEIEQDDKLIIENNPVQNKYNFNEDEVQNYYDDEQLFGADCDNVSFLNCIFLYFILRFFILCNIY